jgi:hypothetical protein
MTAAAESHPDSFSAFFRIERPEGYDELPGDRLADGDIPPQ